MTSFVERKIGHFIDRVNHEALVRRRDGKIELDSAKLSAIVRTEPELAELVVKTYCAAARQGQPELFQMALMVAVAHEIESGDSSLVRHVRSAAEGKSIKIGIGDHQGGAVEHDVGLGRPTAIRSLQINDIDPVNGDVRHLIRVFREIEQNPASTHGLKAAVGLSFPGYEKDPRPDFMIPEIRACIAAIDATLPYFLYYIIPHRRAGQVTIYTNSLLPLSDFKLLPGQWQYSGATADVALMLIPRILAVQEFCRRAGDDESEVIDGLLENFPADFVNIFRDALRP